MDEIRNSQFSLSDKTVNGFVAIAMQLNPKVQEMELDDVIELEEKEYQNILSELDGLDVLSDDESIPLDGEEYLIYKLEKDCHVTTSTPANEFTQKFYEEELKKIEDALD
jgi:DNA-directed RNA polymerase specialized sigma subunit